MIYKITIFLAVILLNVFSVKSNTEFNNNDIQNINKFLHAKTDTDSISTYLNILKTNSYNEDSIGNIFTSLITITDKIYLKYKADTSKKYLIKYFIPAYRAEANYYLNDIGDYDKTLNILNKLLLLYKQNNDSINIGRIYNFIGNAYKFNSEFDKALVFYQKYADINKKTKNKKGEAYAHIGIANVFINWEKYNDAIKNYTLCKNLCIKIADTTGLAASVTGIGNVYFSLNNMPEAIKNHKLAYKYYSAIKDSEGIALALLNIGQIYTNTKEYDKALKVYNEALNLAKIKNIKNRIALIYNLIAEVYFDTDEINNSINYYNKSIAITKNISYKKITVTNYLGLSNCYITKNNYKKAYEYLSNYYSLKDSIFNEEKHKQLTDAETKYKTAQKEKLIKQQKYKLEKDEILNEKRTFQRNFALIILVLFLGIIIFYIRSYRIKKKSNILLSEQRDKIEQQRNNVEKQKKIIETIHQEVSQSIDYATRLQNAILPDIEIIKKQLSEISILYKPKDKVSGDFYWWANIEDYTIIAVADCTGHGVPGAFMSMLGSSLLREIVQKEYITHTSVILKRLRKEVIKALKQTGVEGEQKDGMDMSIISINHQTKTVQYSGANNPIYIIKSKELKSKLESINLFEAENKSNYKLYEIKPDKMPIAIFDKMDNFSAHEIDFEKGDQIYMFSDGYADQFGGEKNKKFKYKPFKELLLKNANKPMKDQKEILLKTFIDWKGNYEQIDDIVVLGIKI